MPCSCDARDVAVIQMKCTARPVHRLSGFYAYASTVPFVSALILTSVWVLQHVFFRVLVPSAPLLLCFSDPPVLRAAAQTCVPMWDISLAGQSRPRVSPWTRCSSCCSAAGPAGGSAQRGATYSTAQEQHTGFSSRCDDAHVFYVYMSESVQKESGRPSPKALEHARCQVFAGSPRAPTDFDRVTVGGHCPTRWQLNGL